MDEVRRPRVEAVLATLDLDARVAQLSCAGRCYELAELTSPAVTVPGTSSGTMPDTTPATINDAVVALLDRFPHGIGQLGRPSTGRDPAVALALTTAVQRDLRACAPARRQASARCSTRRECTG